MSPPTAAPPSVNDRLRLPAGAPRLRVTIGAGTAAQKTWILRKPVTLLGSRRKCQVCLQHPEVSKAHCAIVNTGADVLLSDLASQAGTFLNGERVDLVPLADGDVIRVGPTQIQVAIQADTEESQKSDAGLVYADPTRMPFPIALQRQDAAERWELSRSVSMLGRREDADVCLDHADISLAHAIVFPLAGRPAIFDLASRSGTWVNGKEQVGTALADGFTLRLGPFELRVETPFEPCPEDEEPLEPEPGGQPVEAGPEGEQPQQEAEGRGASEPEEAQVQIGPAQRDALDAPIAALGGLEDRITALQQDIVRSWERLSRWQRDLEAMSAELEARGAELDEVSRTIEQQEETLVARFTEIERRLQEAVTREEQAKDREQACEAQAAKLESERAVLDEAAEKLNAREHELRQREDALAARHAEMQVAEKKLGSANEQLAARQAEWEARQRSLAEELARMESDRAALAEQRARLDAAQKESDLRKREIEQWQASIAATQAQASKERQRVEELLAELATRQQELAQEQQRIQHATGELDSARADITQKVADLKARERTLADKLASSAAEDERLAAERKTIEEQRRQADAAVKQALAQEAALAEQRAAVAEQRAECQARMEKLDRSEQALAERDARFQRRAAELEQLAADITEREQVMARFHEILDSAAHTFESSFETLAGGDGRAAPPCGDAADGVESAPTDDEDRAAPEPAEDVPAGPNAAGADMPAAEKGPAAGPATGTVRSVDLDPVVASKLRVLRRVSPGASDEELLRQIEQEDGKAYRKNRQGRTKKKASWWRR